MATNNITTMPSGVKYEDHVVGTGATPNKGQMVTVHYTGWLDENGTKGKKFDSSHDRGQPLVFPVGRGRVIKGWDEGVGTMRVGGKRKLVIPVSSLALSNAYAPVIPFGSVTEPLRLAASYPKPSTVVPCAT